MLDTAEWDIVLPKWALSGILHAVIPIFLLLTWSTQFSLHPISLHLIHTKRLASLWLLRADFTHSPIPPNRTWPNFLLSPKVFIGFLIRFPPPGRLGANFWAAKAWLATYSDLRTATSNLLITKAAMGHSSLHLLCLKMGRWRSSPLAFPSRALKHYGETTMETSKLKCPNQFKGLQQESLKTLQRDLLRVFISFWQLFLKYCSLVFPLADALRGNTQPPAQTQRCTSSLLRAFAC